MDNTTLVILIIVMVVWLFLPAIIAYRNGRRWRRWFVAGLFLPVVAIIILALLPRHNIKTDKENGKSYDSEKRNLSELDKKEPPMKKSYSDDFKKSVADAAMEEGATLASVAQNFDVNPTLVRNWKLKFYPETTSNSEVVSSEKKSEKINKGTTTIGDWLADSKAEGTIDGSRDFVINLETTDETISEDLRCIFVNGTEEISLGDVIEKNQFSEQITPNEINYLRSAYISSVDAVSQPFSYQLNLDCLVLRDLKVTKFNLQEGLVFQENIKFGELELKNFKITKDEDGDFKAEGEIVGASEFVYVFSISKEMPDDDYYIVASMATDVEKSEEIYEYLTDYSKNDELFLILGHFSEYETDINIRFSGQATLEEAYDFDEENHDETEASYELDDEDEDLFPFEDYKTATAVKFVKFVHALPDATFSAVEKYITDGYDLIENNGVLEDAKDEAQLIKIGAEEGNPFEDPDSYLECLIQNIHDEIEMYGLQGPAADSEVKTLTDGLANDNKSIFDITSQPIGSVEFKIEIASACAESGMPYLEFAKLYNLNADELNSWATEFLGKELD